MKRYASRDGRLRLFVGDSRRLAGIATGSVGIILTSPPYWVRGRGRARAERYARELATGFAREWRRVLADHGDLWLVIGDRHDGDEWVGIDGLVAARLRRAGFRLQSKGLWAQVRSRERWDNRVNHLLRFRKADRPVRPDGETLCWMLPLPRSHPESLWDATPEPVIRHVLERSARRGVVLDPFAGAGTVGRIAAALGREWIGVERDPQMAELAARRLRLHPVTGSRRSGSPRVRHAARSR
ncbi:MAG TPA: site-specific DNA-methyltransferase [Methylomirabilota bacterium]|nr:site-specific DNA-methyltransferase [Methylomirabilota bacterium]